MSNNNFVLSEKIWSGIGWTERDRLLKTSDVKEFIRLLKEDFEDWTDKKSIYQKIDDRLGDELI